MSVRSLNKVMLIGNLTRDPELSYTPQGTAVCTFGLATNRSWMPSDGSERHEETEWHNIVFFGRLAEIAAEYLRKGSQVYVEGSLRTRKWEGKDGVERYTTETVANEMQMLGGRSGCGSAPASAPSQQSRRSAPAPASSAPSDDFDDDIPF